jgi:hypothetical protein
MAPTAATAGSWSQAGTCVAIFRSLLRPLGCLAAAGPWLAAAFAAMLLGLPGTSVAAPIKGEATFSAGGGFARLVLKFSEDVGTEVTTAGSIIVIRFEQPVDISVDKLSDAVPDYVGSARRDPDGSAIRLSLARRATINTMTAGERVFVNWPSARGSPNANCASSVRWRRPRSARRSGFALPYSRHSSVSFSKCPTVSASLRC